MGVSMRPSEMSEGGFFVPGVYQMTKSRFQIWTYPTTGQTTFAFVSHLIPVPSLGAEAHDRAWSIGDQQFFGPSADGREIVQIGTRERIAKSSNFGELVNELVRAGYPDSLLTDFADTNFDGMFVSFATKEIKREGMNSRRGGGGGREEQGDQQTATIVIPVHIQTPPTALADKWAVSGGGLVSPTVPNPTAGIGTVSAVITPINAAAAAETNGSAAAAGFGSPEDAFMSVAMRMLEDGPVSVSALRTAFFGAPELAGYSDKSKVSALANNRAFLSGLDEKYGVKYNPDGRGKLSIE